MRQIIFYLLTLLFLFSCKKDKNNNMDTPTYYTYAGQIGFSDNSTIISNDNNLLICGNLSNNISVLKLSKLGNQIWRKDFYTGEGSVSTAIAESNINELFICGYTLRNYANSSQDVLLIKTNSNGDTIWTKTYGGINADYSTSIIFTSDGNLLMSGKTESFGAGSFGDIYLVKVNKNGDTLWTNSYPDPDQEVPFHLIETHNGEYLITGTNEDNSNPRELYLLKVSSSGKQLWNKKIGPANWKWGYSTIELSSGDLMTCGQYEGHVLLVKTNDHGIEYWEKEYGDSFLSEQGNSIKQNLDGTFTIIGSSYDVKTMQSDIILIKIDQSGNQIWYKKFGGSANDFGNNLIKDINDDNIITGTTYSYGQNASNGNIYMIKTDKNGVFK